MIITKQTNKDAVNICKNPEGDRTASHNVIESTLKMEVMTIL